MSLRGADAGGQGQYTSILYTERHHIPPAEHEADYYDRQRQQTTDQTPTLT
ncbi:MAG: hypothetical protein ACI9CV_000592 [Ilumatobacter sp.]|jgi:hypothetical protein